MRLLQTPRHSYPPGRRRPGWWYAWVFTPTGSIVAAFAITLIGLGTLAVVGAYARDWVIAAIGP
jgi:hypothetical protein